MRGLARREPNPFYSARRHHHSQLATEVHATGRQRRWRRIKEVLIHVGLFIAGVVLGTMAGLIVLSLLEKWLG
jgi:hypothetical protein